uniref:CCR4-NOT transcription complex subunit 1 n=1 Tax=Rhizophora mucronata TaxID=61149 RepID=A0A2P2MSF3_RHIMU
MAASISERMCGGSLVSGSKSIFKLGVDGSGSLILRGNALRIMLRICMQLGGIISQNVK